MSRVDKTPQINAAGKYVLATPFSEAPFNIANSYKAEAINGFEALAERGVNVYTSYYEPKGISNSEYEADRALGINIVTLMGGDGVTLHVPSSYILSYPNEPNVPYGRIVIAVDLGPLPADYVLDDLKSEIQAVAFNLTGNSQITVSQHLLPTTGFVDSNQAVNLATSRLNETKDNLNMYASKILTTEQLDSANTKISGLEEIIKGKLGFS